MNRRDINYWIEMVLRRRKIAIRAGAVVFGLIVLGTFLWPPVYQSTAKILVQDNRAQYLVSSALKDGNTPQNAAIIANPVSEEDLNSELELLTSTHLIEQAIANIPMPLLYEGPAEQMMSTVSSAVNLPSVGYHLMHETPNLTPRDLWAIKLEHHLDSAVLKRSNVIEVSFRAHDPKWAQDFLQRLMNEYLAYHARISHDPEAQKFFAQQAEALQKRLYASQENLRAFEVANGITDLDAQRQALVQRLSDLQIQRARNGAQLASAHEQVTALQAQVNGTSQRIGEEEKSVQDLALSQLKPQVAELKAQRAELLTRYQPTSEKMKEIDAKLTAAEKILNHENRLVVQERSTNLNPVWVTLEQNLEQAKTSNAAGSATATALANEINQAHAELIQMDNNAVSMERLQSQVNTDQEAYLSFVRKSEEARTAQGLNLNKILNVSIAQPPTEPLRPIFPIIWLNLIAGMVLAAGAGLGAAYWEEERDPKIYSAAAISDVSGGLNTIAVLHEQV
ncbi:MAG: GumC family protein [Candidatus Binataceae bacterium]